jgi:AcrR family transcriptional regulator
MAAGQRVLARKGEGLTVSDVVAEADVSNGTFYNYFPDRDALIEALVEEAALSLAAAAAREPIEDPAGRFAVATARMILHAREDPIWARVMLRLVGRPGAGLGLTRYLRDDLAEGLAQGRFEVGPDEATLDLVAGLVILAIRRIVEGRGRDDTVQRAVERGLRALGVAPAEAAEIAAEALTASARTA